MTVLEYFNSTHGARKGLADTALKTANSGYLTRRLVDVAQDCIICEEDCGTQFGVNMRVVVEGGEVVAPLSERVLGRTTIGEVIHPKTGKLIAGDNQILDEDQVEQMDKAGIDVIYIRSPLTCESRIGICASCYGRDLARGSRVNIGEAVGVIAAQSIGEPGTQLTMRTFHIGGAVQRGAEQSSVDATSDGVIRLVNATIVVNSAGNRIVMSRNCEMVLVDDTQREKARHRLPYGSKLLVSEAATVKKGDKLVEWDPHTLPILTEIDGLANFQDLIEGLSVREQLEETTGISSRVVIDWRQQQRGNDLKPRISITNEQGEPQKLPNGMDARYFMSVDSILSVENLQKVKAGDAIARIPRESSKARDITGGLPRVAELFEARRPKDYAIISEIDGRIEFGKDQKAKRRIIVQPLDDSGEAIEHMVSKGKHINVREGDIVSKGDLLMDGSPVPHDILRILGVEALAEYLIKEIQDVYRLQGVKINDKHIEVIARQMLQKVEIDDAGDTTYLIGEQIDKLEFEAENRKMVEQKLRSAKAHPVLQAITTASLQTNSFISAASFQETTRVLTSAAVGGKIDYLEGLKENVIVGRLIPAGTGSVMNRLRVTAGERDKVAKNNEAMQLAKKKATAAE